MDQLTYLDNGATSFPKPESVYLFMDQFYRSHGVSPGRSGYDLSIETEQVVEDTRKALTTLFNGTDPNRLIFSSNATDALNLAISGLLRPNDHVITTRLEHNAVLRPLYHHAMDHNVVLDHVRFDENGFLDPEEFLPLFRPATRMVVVNHASNVLGTIQPVKEIGRMCRERDVIFMVDASQSAGKIAIDVQEMNIDVLVFTGHKSLFGPTGSGGMYVGKNIHIRHTRAGGTGVRSADLHHLEDYPFRMEYGTLNVLGIAGLFAGVKWVVEKGIQQIHAHEMKLVQRLQDGLSTTDNVRLYCADHLDHHIGILSFSINGISPENTGTLLDGAYNIACRTGLHCAPLVHQQLGTDTIGGTVRISVGPFNTITHIDSAVKAVQEIARDFGRKSERSDHGTPADAGH